MSFVFQCPQCGRRFKAQDSKAGKSYRCGCGAQFEIPAAVPGEALGGGLHALALDRDMVTTPRVWVTS